VGDGRDRERGGLYADTYSSKSLRAATALESAPGGRWLLALCVNAALPPIAMFDLVSVASLLTSLNFL
jgi:hypothetical protein